MFVSFVTDHALKITKKVTLMKYIGIMEKGISTILKSDQSGETKLDGEGGGGGGKGTILKSDKFGGSSLCQFMHLGS